MNSYMITRWNMIRHQHFQTLVPHRGVFLLHDNAQDNVEEAQYKAVT
jgi:hypothetical protein